MVDLLLKTWTKSGLFIVKSESLLSKVDFLLQIVDLLVQLEIMDLLFVRVVRLNQSNPPGYGPDLVIICNNLVIT